LKRELNTGKCGNGIRVEMSGNGEKIEIIATAAANVKCT
jgi:hypothetical protein